MVLISYAYAQMVSSNDHLYWQRYRGISYSSYNLRMPVKYDKQKEFLKERDIKSFSTQVQRFNKKGKAQKVRFYKTFEIDTGGRVSKVSGGRTGKSIGWSNIMRYNDKGYLYYLETLNKEGKVTQIQQSNYYKDRIGYYDFVKMSGDGDTLLYTIREPLDTHTLTSSDYLFKKGKLKYTWHNEYYPDKNIKKTTATDKKGKVKYVWSFDCKDEGVEINKRKDTTTTCVSREYSKDSILTIVKMSISSNGSMNKFVHKYNRDKKTIYYSNSNETKGYLLNEAAYEYNEIGEMIKYIYTNYHKGETSRIYTQSYDNAGNVVTNETTKYKKGEVVDRSVETYDFDDKKRPIVRKRTDAEGNIKTITTYTYDA